MTHHLSTRLAMCAVVVAAFAAGCSSNAGFGGAPPYPGAPQANPTPPVPLSATALPGQPAPGASGQPTTPLAVDSASARLAYDASAADPMKAPRLVEVTFALNNPAPSPVPVGDVAIAADSDPATHVALSLQAMGQQDTQETLVAVAPPKDISKAKQLALTFGDGKGKMLAQSTIDFPALADVALTALDKKHAAGGLTIDDVAITAIKAPGPGLHYDVTFSATNASTADASIAYFVVTPPQADAKTPAVPVKLAVPMRISARTEMAPISIVVTYADLKAKSLPSGKYAVTASDGKSTIASGSGPLL